MKRTRWMLVAGLLWSVAATAQGVEFEQELSWQQAKEKAKREGKYIFLDLMATWCGPCKMMDSLVYPSNKVGDFFNKHFISVKVQMDRTKNDNRFIQNWYAAADSIKNNFAIASYPTFLFFSPEGKLIGRSSGFQAPADFVEMAKISIDKNYSFPALVQRFEENKLNHSELRILALKASEMKEEKIAKQAAKKYIKSYLNQLRLEDLKKKEPLDFILRFSPLLESTDSFFQLFYTQGDQMDRLIQRPGLSRSMILGVVSREEVYRRLWNEETLLKIQPHWDSLQSLIANKYSEDIALPVIINAKIKWYEHKEQWEEVVKYNVEKIEKLGLDTAGLGKVMLNNMIYYIIFTYSNDKEALNKGIKWMEMLLSTSPDQQEWRDTYANLLYKTGRVQEAIDQETKALKIATRKNAESSIASYKKTIALMKEGKPTW